MIITLLLSLVSYKSDVCLAHSYTYKCVSQFYWRPQLRLYKNHQNVPKMVVTVFLSLVSFCQIYSVFKVSSYSNDNNVYS